MKKERSFFLVAALYFSIFLAVVVNALSDFSVPADIHGNEDELFVYNFTSNLSSQSWNENLLFSIVNISAANYPSDFAGTGYSLSGYPWISFNSSTGIFSINATSNNQTAVYTTWVVVTNGSGQSRGDSFSFNISSANDAPRFLNLNNMTLNMTQSFNYAIDIADEENDYPFNLTINFTSCSVAQWSSRNCLTASGRELFNSSQYTFNATTGAINISFTPSKNDVGSYIFTLNITDSGNASRPYNNSVQAIVNFTVNVMNSAPVFRYVCDNERSATEDSIFSCPIDASDTDEVNNLTFASFVNSTLTWMKFNSTGTNTEQIAVNITTQFNGTAIVNFTPDDRMVGNWSVNITVNDTGSPTGQNSTAFYFFVSNVPDSTLMDSIDPMTVYTSNNYTNIYISAYDDDLLVPDKSIMNEALSFVSNDSRVLIQVNNTVANRTNARISFNGSAFTAGVHVINLSVYDSGMAHVNSTLLTLNVASNTAPSWLSGTSVNFTLTENSNFYLNLTENVTDPEGSNLNFSYLNFSSFSSFTVNRTTGIINITPLDTDVGRQHVVINVTDGITQVPLSFTFVVNNVNDTPAISEPLLKQPDANLNFSIDAITSSVTTSEDNYTSIKMRVIDGDFNITQRAYYNESLTVSTNITGPNPSLFSFVPYGLVPLPTRGLPSDYSTQQDFLAAFIPNKTDTGNYTVNVTVTDAMGLQDSLIFNITINEIAHAPTLAALGNRTSAVNRSLAFDLNGSDAEDGIDSTGNLTYTYEFLADGSAVDFINNNQSLFNLTTGAFSVTFNDSQAGKYHMNFSLTDLNGSIAYMDAWILVYGVPVINLPAQGNVLNLSETIASNVTFNATHATGDNLTYIFHINNMLRHQINASSANFVNWSFTPNATDETYGQLSNVTLTVFAPLYPELNASRAFYMNISHTNAPVNFNGSIPNSQANYGQIISINLEAYMHDVDSADPAYNQTLYFTVVSNMSSNSTITTSIANGSIANNSLVLAFSASATAFETFNVTVSDSQYQSVSNTFSVQFTAPTVQQGSTQTSTGGGGGGSVRPVSLNIIAPGTFTARKQDKIVVPITVHNTGSITLSGISLRNVVAKNGILREDLIASFDKSFISSLQPNQKENLTLIVDIDTSEVGLYEVTLNGTSVSPPYTDTSKLYINVEEGDTTSERISFTEEFLAQNPQCVEMTEMVDEAKRLYSAGDILGAQDKAEDALSACKKAISQASRAQTRKQAYSFILDNSTIIAAAAIFAGVGYYWLRRMRMQREGNDHEDSVQFIK